MASIQKLIQLHISPRQIDQIQKNGSEFKVYFKKQRNSGNNIEVDSKPASGRKYEQLLTRWLSCYLEDNCSTVFPVHNDLSSQSEQRWWDALPEDFVEIQDNALLNGRVFLGCYFAAIKNANTGDVKDCF